MSDYSRIQRLTYLVKRHSIFLVLLIPSLLYLRTIDEGALLALILTRTARAALGVSLAILFAKFAFPRVDIQREIIEEQNVAVAILFLGIIVGANL